MNQIPLFKVFMSNEAAINVGKVLNSGYIGQGPIVENFENELKKVFDNDLVLTTNSATSAEHLAIHLLKKPHHGWNGMDKGDEILATPLTCTASNWPILANNFKIKWVDVDPKTLNMDLDDLSRKISPTTKAIMLVHWGGYPVDLDKIKEIQKQALTTFGFKPVVIEDSAHAFMSKYKGKPIGSHGNINTFSFQAIKHLTCGDGGALVLPHEWLYDRAKLIRWYGINRETNRKDFRCETNISEWGFKFHMNDINASIGLSNLPSVKNFVVPTQISNGEYYRKELKYLDGVELLDYEDHSQSSYWLFSMKVKNRDQFMDKMKDAGIVVSKVHERNDKHTCVSEFETLLPNLEKINDEIISIPVGWWVTKEQRDFIVNTIKSGW